MSDLSKSNITTEFTHPPHNLALLKSIPYVRHKKGTLEIERQVNLRISIDMINFLTVSFQKLNCYYTAGNRKSHV